MVRARPGRDWAEASEGALDEADDEAGEVDVLTASTSMWSAGCCCCCCCCCAAAEDEGGPLDSDDSEPNERRVWSVMAGERARGEVGGEERRGRGLRARGQRSAQLCEAVRVLERVDSTCERALRSARLAHEGTVALSSVSSAVDGGAEGTEDSPRRLDPGRAVLAAGGAVGGRVLAAAGLVGASRVSAKARGRVGQGWRVEVGGERRRRLELL